MPRIFLVIIALLTALLFSAGATASFALESKINTSKGQHTQKARQKPKKG